MIIFSFHRWVWIRKIAFTLICCVAICVLARWCANTIRQKALQRMSCIQCNVVILDLDILRSDALRCDEKNIRVIPNLCMLIRRGTNFSHAFSQTSWSLPSELSMVTGLYPNVHHVWNVQRGSLPPSSGTLAEFLKGKGYQTYFLGIDSDAIMTERNGGLRGYMHTNLHAPGPPEWLDAYRSAISASSHPILFHAYSEWLHIPYLLHPGDTPISNMPKPKGFPVYQEQFDPLWYAYLVAHAKDIFTPKTIADHPEIFQADPALRGRLMGDFFKKLDREHDYTQRFHAWDTYYETYMQFINPNQPSDVSYLRMMYKSRLHTLDESLSDFIHYLNAPDVASHTIVVITSSHGEAFGEHGTFSHNDIPYNELYHVPLIIIYPSGAGQTVDSVAENIDIYPTVAELVTGFSPKNIQGVSLAPVMSGISVKVKPYAFSMNYEDVFVVQTRTYALIVYNNSQHPPELYDVFQDPGETHNIVHAYPAIYSQFQHVLSHTLAPELYMHMALPAPIPQEIRTQKVIKNGYF